MPRKILIPEQLDFQSRPTYPYSPGTRGGNMVYTGAQTRQTLSNVGAVLKEGGADRDDVLKCKVYLKDMRDFQKMNNIFSEISPDNPPARSTVQTPMAGESMLVEIEAIAYIGD